MGFFKRLEARVRQIDSLVCVGLDPHPEDLDPPSAGAARDFCLRLVEATGDFALAYKPNIAFFELYGAEGIDALQQVIAAIPNDIPVILDAKRGDIASTAQLYAQTVFQTLRADAVTVNPYLGGDAVEPFLENPEKGVFLLCKTSNLGSADIQDLPIFQTPEWGSPPLGTTVYQEVARLGQTWNRAGNLGLVVGATFPEMLSLVRKTAPQLWILAPGVGAQGGDLKSTLEAGLRMDGLGLLVSVSRGVSRAGEPRQAARELRDRINLHRMEIASGQPSASEDMPIMDGPLTRLANALLESGCVKFGQFTLKSGMSSPIYLDLRRLVGFPSLLNQVASAYLPILHRLTFNRLAALPYAALPIATAISLQGGWSLVYPRKEVKPYGTQAEIEGVYETGERVVVVDDLATTGESKFEAIQKLTEAGLEVKDVVVLIDRQSGAPEALARGGFRFHAVFTLHQLLDTWEQMGSVSSQQATLVRDFLADV